MDTATTTASEENSGAVMVFHCTLLNCKIQLKQCRVNWEISNVKDTERKLAPNLKGQAARLPVTQCMDCPRGRYHYEQGHFESGLRVTALRPAVTAPFIPPPRAVGGVEKVEPAPVITGESFTRPARIPLEELYSLPPDVHETTLPPPDEAGKKRDTVLPSPSNPPRVEPPADAEPEVVDPPKPEVIYETKAPDIMPPIQNDKETSRDFEPLPPYLELLRATAIKSITADQRNVRAWGSSTRTNYSTQTKKTVEALFKALNGNSKKTAQHVGVPEALVRRWFGGRTKTHVYKIMPLPLAEASTAYRSALGYLERDKTQQKSFHVALSDATVFWLCRYVLEVGAKKASLNLGLPERYVERLVENADIYEHYPPYVDPTPAPEPELVVEPEPGPLPEPEPEVEEPEVELPEEVAPQMPIEPEKKPAPEKVEPEKTPAMRRSTFPLREDLDVELLLPRDITDDEVERLSAFIGLLVLPTKGKKA